MTDVTRALARHISSSRYDRLPPEIRHEGVRAFMNWVGCTVGGAYEPIVDAALPILAEFNGAATSTVVGRRERLDALNATLVNSMSSSALAFNDTHYRTVAHPTSPVGAALLAMAERQPVSGRDFVHAFVMGVEIQCRVGNILCTPPAECPVGLSMAGLVGAVGAAVAAGCVMGLDEQAMAVAIGHAANHSSGLRETHATMASHYTPGNAARNGLLSALFAQRGFTCSDQVLEGVKGFAASYALRANPEAALEGLGNRYEIADLAYKPYPSGFVVHPVIDACLDLARSRPIDPARIERIELTVNPLTIQLTNRPTPTNRTQAFVSFPHWAAVSFLHKAATVAQVTDAMVHDPVVAALRLKVAAAGDPAMAREAARVRVVMQDGSSLEHAIAHCRGSAGHPLPDADLTEKTQALLAAVYGDAVARDTVAECWKIADYPSAGAIAQRLGAPQG